jgi:hypothetical protein
MSQQPQSSTTQTAKDEASSVARTAADSGGQVADTAKQEGQKVVSEAVGQARNLMGEARSQVAQQATSQQSKAVSTVRSLGDELQTMASSSDSSGIAAEVVRQAATRVQGVADWLESREPQDLIEDVRSFARRKPGAFLFGAAAAGLAAGRLTRAGVDAKRDTSSSSSQSALPSYETTYATSYESTHTTYAGTPESAGEGDLWPVGGAPTSGQATDYDTGYDPVTPTQPAGTEIAPGVPGTANDPLGPPR